MAIYFIRKPEDAGKQLLLSGMTQAFKLTVHEAVEIITAPEDEAVLGPLLDSLASHVVRNDLITFENGYIARLLTPEEAADLRERHRLPPIPEMPAADQPPAGERVDQVLEELFPAPETQEAATEVPKNGRAIVPCKECGTPTDKRSGYCSNRCYQRAYARRQKGPAGEAPVVEPLTTTAQVVTEKGGHNPEHIIRSGGGIKGRKVG